MIIDHRKALLGIKRFDQLIAYLRDELGWPISRDSFDDVDDLFYDFSAEELGIDPKTAAKIQEIKRLRPLSAKQPWGIFFVKFEPKKLPVVVLRRILSQVALKRRESANSPERTAWSADDLLFISNYGEGDERQISFAHFSQSSTLSDLPTLRVLGWNNLDTPLHLDEVAAELTQNLRWPEDDSDLSAWRKAWSNAFKLGHNEVINTAKDLSIRLAELASNIRDRIKVALAIESETGPLTKLLNAFQSSLVSDLDADGFADMYAQTIAYGLLSARITDPTKKTIDDFTSHMQTSPFLKELLETFLHVGGRKRRAGGSGIDFDELGVDDVIQLLDNANMEAVVRDFGDRNRQEDPVMHFFEGFLHAYDKKIRKDRGVFYTPQSVVSFIVQSVHELLIEKFGLKDGLADTTTWGEILKKYPDIELPVIHDATNKAIPISLDEPFVQILDPATGTSTFLVEVVDVVYRTLTEKWEKSGLTYLERVTAWNDYVPSHLLPRLHAFELMMAPYAIAHMKIGLKLAETGYRFESEERARIYLTNTLEPWAKQAKLTGIEALAHEANAVNLIKRNKRFTVVIGNPPYSIQSQNLSESAKVWSDRYRYLDGELIREKGALQFEKALQDDCVKFTSFSQQCIADTKCGIVGLIISHGFIDSPTLRGMRQNLGEHFNSINVLDLHGNSTKKERSPDGSEDKNVFDIKQGVAILIGARLKQPKNFAEVKHGEYFGTREYKYSQLKSNSILTTKLKKIAPASPSYLFKPQNIDTLNEYQRGIKVTDIFIKGNVGIITARDNLVIDFDEKSLVDRATLFRDSTESNMDLCETLKISLKKGWDITKAREQIKKDSSLKEFVKPLCYRPFDSRLIFYHPSLIWGMSYPTMQHMLSGENLAMLVGRAGQVIGQGQWDIVFCTRGLSEFNLFRRGGHNLLPLYLTIEEQRQQLELDYAVTRKPNLSENFLKILSDTLGVPQTIGSLMPAGIKPEDIFYYIYSILYSPVYRERYAEFLKIDYPRIPLTPSLDLFKSLSNLGNKLVSSSLMECSSASSHIKSTSIGKDSKIEKVSWSDDTIWIDKDKLNGFEGVVEDVWSYHVGGYQVCEKWLKDRKDRVLSSVDIEYFKKIIISISKTIELMNQIDEKIDEYGGWPDAFIS